MLNLAVESTEGDTIIVKAKGRIVQAGVSPLSDPLADAIQGASYDLNVLIDLEDVEYIDSSGVGWLLNCNKRFRDAGGNLVLHSCSSPVMNTLRVLKLDQVLRLAEDESAARQICEKHHG